MKMEMPVVAECLGVVASVTVEENALVEQGTVLLTID
jgi:biotin carboxyl carrier protein